MNGMSQTVSSFYEERAHRLGFQRVAGIDEAGRGPLAGPVVAAAVVLPTAVRLPGVEDSKKMTAHQREEAYLRIVDQALGFAVVPVDAGEIDRTNILQATFKAMMAAVASLSPPPDYLLIDGPYRLPLATPQEGIPKGDQLCLSIAAASVLAKVYRDRLMTEFHEMYPQYGFDRHKGYGTKTHCRVLELLGPCPIHRRSFRRVK